MKRRLLQVRMKLAHLLGLLGPVACLLTGGDVLRAQAGFTPPVVVSSEDTAEPKIDIAPGGLLYINAPAGLLSSLPGSASFLFRSRDGGATWSKTPAGVRGLFPGGGDSDVAIDGADGRIYFADLWLGSSTVSVSQDQGESWQSNPLDGVIVEDRQWLATPGGGRVYLATHQIPAGIVVSKSVNGGLTFLLSSVAATALDQTGCICPSGNIISEAGGLLLGLGDKVGVIYATSSGGIKFALSTNGGLTFASSAVSQVSGVDTSTNFPIVANAGNGHLVATWLEVRGDATRVQINDSFDWGATWKTPRTLVSSGASVFPWVAARGAKIAISLYHTREVGAPNSVPESAQWFESYLESTNGGATFSAQTIDSTPVKSGPICTEGAGCGEDRELLDFQSVAIDAAGRSVLTWTRSIDNVSDTEIRFARQM